MFTNIPSLHKWLRKFLIFLLLFSYEGADKEKQKKKPTRFQPSQGKYSQSFLIRGFGFLTNRTQPKYIKMEGVKHHRHNNVLKRTKKLRALKVTPVTNSRFSWDK